MKPVQLGPWPVGVNNRLPDHALPQGALRNCINADIDSMGKAKRRDGFQKVAGALSARGGYSCEAGVFFVDGQRLLKFNDDDTLTDLGGPILGEHVAYAYANGTVYLTDGSVCKRISGGTLLDWGVETPLQPIMSSTGGSMAAGAYMASISYVRADGQEGGACHPVQVESTGGVTFFSMPASSNQEVVGIRLYLSKPNGSVLFHVGTVTNGTSSHTITADAEGKQLDSLNLSPPPPGRIVCEYNGRMLIASGKVLWISEPYALERFNLAKGYLQYAKDITIVEPVDDGVWVVADRTYFVTGIGTDELAQSEKLEYGAIFGTGCTVPGTPNKAWHTPRGMVMAGPGGEIKNMTEANVAMGEADSGATMIREHEGTRTFIASLNGYTATSLARATDFFEARVIP